MRSESYNFDLVVIGGGSAGFAAARTAASTGLHVAVVEGGREVGGLCILRGCMPTKSLLYASELAECCRKAASWGIQVRELEIDFAKVIQKKNSFIGEFAAYRREQLTDGDFTFIRGNASFIDGHTLEIENHRTITARYFIIAAGSKIAPSPLEDLDRIGFITSDDALNLETLPRSLIVLGGGPVAVELAQCFSRFGVKTTLIQRSEHILKEFDTDAAIALETAFQREGIEVITGTRLAGASAEGGLKKVRFSKDGIEREVEAEEILFALGRVPNTHGLELDKAGVETGGGRILTNERMQTSAPHIYAAGDCTSPHEIVHLAIQQGETAAHNIAYQDNQRSIDYRLLLNVVFTEPQVAAVGMTKKRLDTSQYSYLEAGYPFNDHGKSITMGIQEGFVKIFADPKSGKILGAGAVGPMAGELIHELVVAMAGDISVGKLAQIPHYHPTLAEIWTYPAEELDEQISKHA